LQKPSPLIDSKEEKPRRGKAKDEGYVKRMASKRDMTLNSQLKPKPKPKAKKDAERKDDDSPKGWWFGHLYIDPDHPLF
jgi:hypothetical protein